MDFPTATDTMSLNRLVSPIGLVHGFVHETLGDGQQQGENGTDARGRRQDVCPALTVSQEPQYNT